MIRRGTSTLLAVIALLLIVIGLWQPVDAEARWLLLLWIAAPLGGTALRLSLPAPPGALPRAVANLGLVVLVGFAMLSLQLLRQQFLQGDAVAGHTVVAADGSVTANVRPVIAAQRVLRGRIRPRRTTAGRECVGRRDIAAYLPDCRRVRSARLCARARLLQSALRPERA